MTEETVKNCDWEAVRDLFGIRDDEELPEAEREEVVNRINRMIETYGRDYVVRKIALYVN